MRKKKKTNVAPNDHSEKVKKFFHDLSKYKRTVPEMFLELSSQEQQACGEEHAVGKSKGAHKTYALNRALVGGYSVEFVKQIFAVTRNINILDPGSIFRNLFSDKSINKLTTQREVSKYFLEYFESKEIKYDPYIPLQSALKHGEDNAALYFLNYHQRSLNIGHYQDLLSAVCHSQPETYISNKRLLIKCIQKLIDLGAELKTEHTAIFFFLMELKNIKKIKSSAVEELIKIFNSHHIPIPISEKLFHYPVLFKQILLQKGFKNCSQDKWLQLEEAMGENFVNFDHDHYFNRDQILALDSVLVTFKVNPSRAIIQPEKLEYIAIEAIRFNHSLIYTLIKRGLNLNYLLQLTPFNNSIADIIAFYSRDKKLIQMLKKITSISAFGRTPAHWAALSMGEANSGYKYYYSAEDIGIASQVYPEPILKMYVVNPISIGSPVAFKNANLLQHATIEDYPFGFTPFDYAAMNVEPINRMSMLAEIPSLKSNNFLEFLLPILPSVLLNMVYEYLFFYSDDPDELVVLWAERLLMLGHLFKSEFQRHHIDPLRIFLSSDNKYIRTKYSINSARTMLQLYNQITLVGQPMMESFKPFIFESIPKQTISPSPEISHAPEVENIPSPKADSSTSASFTWSKDSSFAHLPSLFPELNRTAPIAMNTHHLFNPKKRKQMQDSYGDESWKNRKAVLIESLTLCYRSGSLVKKSLERALSNFIDELERATDAEDVTNVTTSISRALEQPDSNLSRAVKHYGMQDFMEKILKPNNEEEIESFMMDI